MLDSVASIRVTIPLISVALTWNLPSCEVNLLPKASTVEIVAQSLLPSAVVIQPAVRMVLLMLSVAETIASILEAVTWKLPVCVVSLLPSSSTVEIVAQSLLPSAVVIQPAVRMVLLILSVAVTIASILEAVTWKLLVCVVNLPLRSAMEELKSARNPRADKSIAALYASVTPVRKSVRSSVKPASRF